MNKKRFHRFSLRIPNDLHEALKQMAEQHERSLHGEIIYAMRQFAANHRKENTHETPPELR